MIETDVASAAATAQATPEEGRRPSGAADSEGRAMIDATRGNWIAYDRLQEMWRDAAEYGEVKRQRQIDEEAMSLIQQGRPEDAERFLIGSMVPRERRGILGLADRLVGRQVMPQLTPMQQHVISRHMQRALPTAEQEAKQQSEARAAERHPLELQQIQATTQRLGTLGDPLLQELSTIGDVISRLTRDPLVAEDYADEIRTLTQSFQQLVDRITAGQSRASETGPTPAPAGSQAPQANPGAPLAISPTAPSGQNEMALPGNVQMRMDTPPDIRERVRRLLDARDAQGRPLVDPETILNAPEVAPYVVRR